MSDTKYWVYLGVRTCDFFLCFFTFVVLHSQLTLLFYAFCLLCFTSLVNLTGSYTEEEPKYYRHQRCVRQCTAKFYFSLFSGLNDHNF